MLKFYKKKFNDYEADIHGSLDIFIT